MPTYIAATGERTRDKEPDIIAGVPSGGPQQRGPTRSLSADFVLHRRDEVITKHPLGHRSDWVHNRVPNMHDITTFEPKVKYVYKVGHMPDPRINKALGNIVHYMGHIQREQTENLHAMSVQKRNELARRGPQLNRKTHPKSERMVDPPHVPGYMGFIPGKSAESVHGKRFGWANEDAQELRTYNPYWTTGPYLHRQHRNQRMGATQMYQNTVRPDFMNHMNQEEKLKLEPYMQKIALNQKILAEPRPEPKDGPRYLHLLDPHVGMTKTAKSFGEIAGMKSSHRTYEQIKWLMHNRDVREANCSANMRTAF